MKDKSNENWPLPVSVKTDRWGALAVMLLCLVFGTGAFVSAMDRLRPLEPPLDPSYNNFLLTKGRHLWNIEDSEGRCVAAAAGGWKVKNDEGDEVLRFHLREKVQGQFRDVYARAIFSQYRVMTSFSFSFGDKNIHYDGKKWSGTQELIDPVMLMETVDQTRILQLPAKYARIFNRFLDDNVLSRYSVEKSTPSEFAKCLKELKNLDEDLWTSR